MPVLDDDPKTRRRAVRVRSSLEIRYWVNTPPIEARVEDISELGMFMDSTEYLAPGTVCCFRLELPDAVDYPVEGQARVIRVENLRGTAMEIVDLEARDRERLRMLVASVFFGYNGNAQDTGGSGGLPGLPRLDSGSTRR